MRGVRTLLVGGELELPLMDGEVTARAKASGGDTVRASLSFPPQYAPVDEWSALMPVGQRLRVVYVYDVGGQRHEVPLGWVHIRSTAVSDTEVKVEAVGLEYLLDQDPMLFPSSPRAGATLLEEARRLAGAHPVVLDPGVEDVAVKPDLSWGFSRWGALTDLGKAHAVEFTFKDDGYLHAVPWDRSGRDTVLSLTADTCVVEVEGAFQWDVYNHVTVVAKTDKNTVGAHYTATLGGRFDPAFYGVKRKRVELEAASTVAQCKAAAEQEINKHITSGRVIKVECAPDPRIELGDVVSCERVPGDWVVGRVCGFSLPLSPGKAMRLDLEELLW